MAKKSEWDDMAALTADIAIPADNISAATVGDTTYTVVDVRAREVALDNRWRIEDLKDIVAGGVNFRGKTAEAIEDLDTSLSVDMADESTLVVEAGKAGDMVIVPGSITGAEDREFIWDGAHWNEFGVASNLKDFAFVDEGEVSITPKGSTTLTAAGAQDAPVTATFTGTAATLTSNVTINSYTPEGSVSIGAYTPEGSITINNIAVGDKSISVNEVSSADFTGNEVSVGATFTGAEVSVGATFTGTQTTLSATTTPSEGSKTFNGTLSQLPELSATGSLNAVTNVSTSAAAAGSATVVNGVLSFNFANVLTAANVTTADVNVNVTPGYKNTLTSVTDIAISTSGNVLTAVAVNDITYTPNGTITTGTFEPSGTVTTTKFTPGGSVSVGQKTVTKTISIGTLEPTGSFTGSAANLTAEFTGTGKAPTAQDVSISYTPAGGVTGTAAVSADAITGTLNGTTETYTVTPVTA